MGPEEADVPLHQTLTRSLGSAERRGQECPQVGEERLVCLKVGGGSALQALQQQHGVFWFQKKKMERSLSQRDSSSVHLGAHMCAHALASKYRMRQSCLFCFEGSLVPNFTGHIIIFGPYTSIRHA